MLEQVETRPDRWPPTLLMLHGDHVEDMTQLRQHLFSPGHQGIAAGAGWHLGDPRAIVLAIEHDLVGVETWVVHVSENATAPRRQCFLV